MRSAVAAACLLTACGRVGFDGGPDLPPDAPCTDPWSLPTEIATGLANPTSPTISTDGLELYLNDLGFGDVYVMRRARRTDPFGPAAALPAPPSTPNADYEPSISRDGLDLYFSMNRMGNAFLDVTHRPNLQAPFEPGVHSGAYGGGDIATGSLALYSQDYLGPIGVWTRATTADYFAAFTPLEAVINDGSTNTQPSISDDGRELYFISNRSGAFELWVAMRPDVMGPFVAVDRVALVLPGGAIDPGGPEISADGHALYFTVRIATVYHLLVSTRCE